MSADFSADYRAVLRGMARDPEIAPQLRAALDECGDEDFFHEVMPLPPDWRSDDYALFCSDRRVRRVEFERRCAAAIEDWREQSVRARHAGLTADTKLRIEEWTRTEFLSEITAWLGSHPGVTYAE